MTDHQIHVEAKQTGGSAPFVTIAGGHQLFVRDWGAGAPVLLMAGWGMDSRSWSTTMLALNDAGLRTIAYDRRGHGRSSDPGMIDYDLLADDLAAVIAAFDLNGVTIVAHSGAAGEAIRYLSRYGDDRVARLILVGATGPRMLARSEGEPGIPAAMVEASIHRMQHDLAGWIDDNAEPFTPGAGKRTIDWLASMVMDASHRLLIDFQRVIANADLTAEASAITTPVTILHGDRDVSAPIDLTARRYAAIIPDAELRVYEGVAHGVMVTHAERLAADIAARAKGGRDDR